MFAIVKCKNCNQDVKLKGTLKDGIITIKNPFCPHCIVDFSKHIHIVEGALDYILAANKRNLTSTMHDSSVGFSLVSVSNED
ncbi:hypothetical protein [Romboutsia ilealis]|uniref:hypothetical protein n=1 Tax=Romboutsia ilealis TaxID=1115758 RepID=UPI002573AAF3|nr:hypothetical protein [Romboutsia ilealis]